MKRFDWIYQFSVTHYKFIMRDIPDPFIFREAHKRVGYARLVCCVAHARMIQANMWVCHHLVDSSFFRDAFIVFLYKLSLKTGGIFKQSM